MIVLSNYFSLAVTICFGLAIILGQTLYMLSREAGRNRALGLFLWNRVLNECEDPSELPEDSMTGPGKMNGFLYLFGVSVDDRGVLVRNLSSAMKRRILVSWDRVESIETWRQEEFATAHARVTLKAAGTFGEVILPWCVDYNNSVPISIGVSGLEEQGRK
jgi:hypothetical protein